MNRKYLIADLIQEWDERMSIAGEYILTANQAIDLATYIADSMAVRWGGRSETTH